MNEGTPPSYRRIRKLNLNARALSVSMRSGSFRSVFRGRGVEFEGLRDYTFEDDASFIDWSASTRAGKPFVKLYGEDRDFSLHLVLDSSASMRTPGVFATKAEAATIAFSLLAFAGASGAMRVGACLFGSGGVVPMPARKGTAHAFMLSERAFASRGSHAAGSDLALALQTVRRSVKRRGIVIVISDFLVSGWSSEARLLARAHDLILVRVKSRTELDPPRGATIEAREGETGRSHALAFGRRSYRERWKGFWEGVEAEWKSALRDARGFTVDADENVETALLSFFNDSKGRSR